MLMTGDEVETNGQFSDEVRSLVSPVTNRVLFPIFPFSGRFVLSGIFSIFDKTVFN